MSLTTILLIVAGILVALAVAGIIIFLCRRRKFVPTPDKEKQIESLNEDLVSAGFAYQPRGDYFYSLMDCWQRKTGYCRLYDEGAVAFNMVIDSEPVEFSYGGKRWLIEFWKGQYGITTGAEIGIYSTDKEDISHEKFTGTFYENIPNDEMLPMAFVLEKNGKTLLKRSGVHWWLTGFKLGEFSEPEELTLYVKLRFRESGMCHAFVSALSDLGYQSDEFSVSGKTVFVRFARPHGKPVESRKASAVSQALNQKNCALLLSATKNYPDTLDKIEYCKTRVPLLYQFFLKSLYSKAFFDTFGWLLDLIFDRSENCQKPTPTPPCPDPEPPCHKPEPPCHKPEPPCHEPEPPCHEPEPPCKDPCPPAEPPCDNPCPCPPPEPECPCDPPSVSPGDPCSPCRCESRRRIVRLSDVHIEQPNLPSRYFSGRGNFSKNRRIPEDFDLGEDLEGFSGVPDYESEDPLWRE